MKKRKLAIIWSHRPYSPYVMSMGLKATVLGLKRVYPKSLVDMGVNYWEDGQNTYLYPEAQYIETTNMIAYDSTLHPDLLLGILKTAFNKAVTLNKFASKFSKEKISSSGNNLLVKWVEKFSELFVDMYAYGTVPILVGYSQDNFLYTTAEAILKRRTKRGTGGFSRCYIILTSQPKLNRNAKFELAIIKLAKLAKIKKVSSVFDIRKLFKKQIKKLIGEFSWLAFDLCDEVSFDELHIANLIAEKTGQDLDKQKEGLLSYEKRTGDLFLEAVKELRLTKKEVSIFECIRNLGYYKWAREYELTEALLRIKIVQDELGKRFGISTLEIKYLLPEEYKIFLENINKFKRELPLRIKRFLLVQEKKGATFLTGDNAEKMWGAIKPVDKLNKQVKIVKGLPAYAGVARGVVRIVNAVRHLSKVSSGDILVAVTTSPSLLPAMKRAAAIVTNEGGITSHAAIVSRELQIPCVVGTKNATKIFKDGDIVEVDAKHGIIKIVNKSAKK